MKTLKKIAAIIALFIGLMSMFAGSKVLLGIDSKDYNVLTWLVVYNVIMGLTSIFAAYLMWKNHYKANNIITFILGMHFLILVYLKFISDTAAHESVMAMIFRVTVWITIAILYIQIPKYLNKPKTTEK